ncbi:hypothetical protein [Amycolatopsis anabasis]|uniref:hypothetical protein n=1 Tax=Amycolatopsis anabasis TaxID=1840409 RepID=UPI00131B596C|nr:hypothetical protein [Amycolatopsis anabasis]
MGEKTTGEKSGISITAEDGYGEKVAKAVPVAGGLVKGVDNTVGAVSDGQLTGTEVFGLVTDAGSFIQSCTDAVSGIASDPIGWLVGQGLNFLITLVQPLQDLIHMVSGDGPALANAAGNFNSIGKGLAEFATKYQQEAEKTLSGWQGDAAGEGATRTAEFAAGVNGIAGEAGNIAKLLQISSMVMTVIEDFIKALLTELITWLIMIWIPALAAAVPTFGASVAEAGAVSTAKGAQTGVKATKQVSKLQKLLNKIQELLAKMKDFLKRAGAAIKKVNQERKLGAALHSDLRNSVKGAKVSPSTKLWSNQGAVGKRMLSGYKMNEDGTAITGGDGGLVGGFAKSMYEAGKGSVKGQVGIGPGGKPAPAKPMGHVNNANKAGQYGEVGEDQSKEQTEEQLDF